MYLIVTWLMERARAELFTKFFFARLPNWLAVTYGSVEFFNAVVNAVQNKCTSVNFLLQKMLKKRSYTTETGSQYLFAEFLLCASTLMEHFNADDCGDGDEAA